MAKRGRPKKKTTKKKEKTPLEVIKEEEETKEEGDSIFDDVESKVLTTEKVFGKEEVEPPKPKPITLNTTEKETIHNYFVGIKNIAFRLRTDFNLGDLQKIKSHCGFIEGMDKSYKESFKEIRDITELCRKDTCYGDMNRIIKIIDDIGM